MISNFELKTQVYNVPKLTALSWGLVTLALGSAIASHYGSYPKSTDVCFYPVPAQERDNKVREQELESSISVKGRKSKQLLGTKFCNVRRGDIATIPANYLIKASNGSINTSSNNLAIISQGLKEGWLYQVQEFPAENPYKVPLGLAATVFGCLGLWSFRFTQDQMATLRPKYRATKRLASLQAGFSLSFAEADLKMAAEVMLVKLRGLREADARKVFLNSVTEDQAIALLQSMNAQDYDDFGYLLDGGASYNRFLGASVSEQVEIETSPEYEPVNVDSQNEIRDKPQYTRTDNLPKVDKYEPFRQAGLSIIKQAGSPGKSKALIAPSRTGKTTVVYFMLEETIRLVGEENLTCYVWQGKGIEPIHPTIPRQNHAGFTLKNFGLESLTSTWEQYEIRQDLLEQGYRDFAPILLIITDWQSIKDQLSSQDSATFKDVTAKLMTLANNGAALGVTVWLDTQSPVIKDWGLGSASIRDNFDIFAIARIGKDNNGQPIGDTKCISKVLENPYLVPSERDRSTMVEQYNLLLDGMASGKIDTSVLLSTAGVVRLGITPKFERKALQFSTVEIKDVWEDTADTPKEPVKVDYVKSDSEPQGLSIKQQVELMLKAGQNYKQICATLWDKKPLDQVAPFLGRRARLDGFKILSECAEYLLILLRGKGWLDVTSDEFMALVESELADYQVSEALEELTLLEYIQVDKNKVIALH